jgi:hypothetical protein
MPGPQPTAVLVSASPPHLQEAVFARSVDVSERVGADLVSAHGRDMTKTQATDIHATQQGAPLCTHLTQELEYVTLSEEGELTGTYHCCACGKALDRIYKLRP